MTADVSHRVLLVEASRADCDQIGACLRGDARVSFVLETAASYSAARERLARGDSVAHGDSGARGGFEVCLLNPQLSDESEFEALQAELKERDIAFITLSDAELEADFGCAGAADGLLKADLSAPLLRRAIAYAIEKKSAQAALIGSQRFLQATVDALPGHIAVLDSSGAIVAANAAWRGAAQGADFVGAGSQIGLNYWQICQASESVTGAAIAAAIRAILAGEMPDFCLEYAGHNAPERWFRVCITRFSGDGPLHLVVGHEDVSERKRAEAKLRHSENNLARAQHLARLGSWELDFAAWPAEPRATDSGTESSTTESPHSGVRAVDDSLCWSDEVFRIFGFEPGQTEVSISSFMLAVHPDDRELIRTAFKRTVLHAEPYDLEHRIVWPDGTVRVVHEQSEVIFDACGQPLKMVGTVQDITARRAAETQLFEREEFQRTLLENFPNGAVNVLDRQGRFVLAAGRGLEPLGLDAAQIVGKTLDEVFAPAQVAFARKQYEQVLSGHTVEFELPFGDRFWNLCAAPLRGGDGEVCNIIAVAQDITQRKQDETRLQWQEMLLKAQAEASLDGILVVSHDKTILSFNRRLLQMWQISPDVVQSGADAPLLQAVLDRVAQPRQFLARVADLYEHPEAASRDELLLRDGRIFDRYSSPITGEDGTIYGRVWYFRDVSEARRAQAEISRLAAIVEFSTDAIISKTLDGTISSWNAGAQALYGYTAGEAVGQSVAMLVAPDRADEEMTLLARTVQGERAANYETVRRHKDGHFLDVSLTVSPIKDESGALVGASAISRDIGGRKAAEAALRDSETRYRSLFESNPQPMWVYDLQTLQFLAVNAAAVVHYGYSRNEFLAMTINEIRPEAEVGPLLAVARRSQNSDWYHGVWKHLKRDGTLIDVEISIHELLFDKRPARLVLAQDITERKQAQAQRDRFFSMAVDILGTFGFDGQFKRINPAFAAALGFAEAEIIGQSFIEWVHPDDRNATLSIVESLAQGQTVLEYENRFRTKTGSYRWLEWKAVPVLEEGLIYAAARDVSERKKTEQTLRQTNDDLERRVEGRTAELARANAQLQLEIAEREEAEIEARTRAVQQQSVADLGHRALADLDIDSLLDDTARLVAQTLGVKFSAVLELSEDGQRFLRRGGSVRVSEHGQPHTSHGDGNSLAGYAVSSGQPVISLDIAQETRFQPSPFMLNQGIVSAMAVKIQCVKHAFGALVVGSLERRAFTPNDITYLQSIANVLATAIDRRCIESRIHDLNEDLQAANAQLQIENTERQTALATLREVADTLRQSRREAEQAREDAERAREDAEQANRAKSEFLSRMSHELRTPLNAILGFGQVLEMRLEEGRQLENVRQILKAGRHLLGLINEVLDIARIEAGHMSLSLEPISVGAVVQETLDLVRPLALARRIELVNALAPEVAGRHHLADQQRLKQVLLNLLSNAVKYNCDGGSVSISGHISPGEPTIRHGFQLEGRLRLQVRDTGAGLSPESLAKLFVPFERLHAARSQIEGTGIGLTLCKQLVEAMEGQIGVSSAVGEGSTFWVELPLVCSPLQAAPLVPDAAASPGARDLGQVLIIEDNLSNLTLIEQALAEGGYGLRFLTAMQGSVGLELARQHLPDLILLDVHLPDIEGDVVLRRLQADRATRAIPVVVLSADATPSNIERMKAEGAADYLSKPLDIQQFFRVVEQITQKMKQ